MRINVNAAAGIEPAVIERAAGDGAGELSWHAVAAVALTSSIEAKPPEAITGMEIAFGQLNGRIEVETPEQSVAGDVGEDDRSDAGILEPLRDFERRDLRGLGPAFDRDLAVTGIEPDRDAAGKFFAALFTSSGSRTAAVPMMTRAMPLPSQASTVLRSRMPPPSCTGMVTAFSIDSTASAFIGLPAKAPSRSTTCRYSNPWIGKGPRLRGGIEVEHGRPRHVALFEAHALAVLEIDGGKKYHGFHFRKFEIKAETKALALLGMKLRADRGVLSHHCREPVRP